MLLMFLESLVVELAQQQEHIGEFLGKEAHENMQSQALKQEMVSIIEENNHESMHST